MADLLDSLVKTKKHVLPLNTKLGKHSDTEWQGSWQIIVISVPVAQWLEHCVSSAKVVGSIPKEHILTKCIAWMHWVALDKSVC